MDTLELLMHPVRLRIVHALSGGRVRTTSELCARMTDVSKATVYRQVATLLDGGVIEVAEERRVHGAVERGYRLQRARVAVDPRAGATMSLAEHRETFAAATAALVAEFNAYLDRDDAQPYRDRVGYRQVSLWLNRRELSELQRELARMMRDLRDNPPEGRRLYLLSPIVFPLEEPAGTDGGEPDRARS